MWQKLEAPDVPLQANGLPAPRPPSPQDAMAELLKIREKAMNAKRLRKERMRAEAQVAE